MSAVGAADVKSFNIIEISEPNDAQIDGHNVISVVFLRIYYDGGRRATLYRRRGDPLSAVRAADVKSFDIIEISGPNNPKIDAHNDISVVFLRF